MTRYKLFFLLPVFSILLLSACTTNNVNTSPAQTVVVQTTIEYVNPYPVPEEEIVSENTDNSVNQTNASQAYPAPEENSNLQVVTLYPENFTSGLQIPPASTGMAVLSGQLMKASENDKPYISLLFLAPKEPANDTDQSPTFNFNRKTNLMAVQDLENGKFVFSEVSPGQYGIVLWSPGRSFFLKDSNGNTLVFEAKSDESNDLGVIYFE